MKIVKTILGFVLMFAMGFNFLTVSAEAVSVYKENEMQRTLKQQYCIASEHEGVFEDDEGNYALAVEVPNRTAPILMPVGYLQVDLLDQTSVDMVLNHTSLSESIKNSIRDMSRTAKPCYDCDKCNLVSIFSPDLLPETRSTTTSYYVYDGTRMKVDQIERDSHTEYGAFISGKGEEFSSKLEGITGVLLGVGGIFSTHVSIFGVGLTLFDAIASCSGINGYGTINSSEVKSRVFFHGISRYTYAYIEDWRIGCVSHSADIDAVEINYVLYDGDNFEKKGTRDILVNELIETESFNNHWAVARNNYQDPKIDGSPMLKVGDAEFYLVVA